MQGILDQFDPITSATPSGIFSARNEVWHFISNMFCYGSSFVEFAFLVMIYLWAGGASSIALPGGCNKNKLGSWLDKIIDLVFNVQILVASFAYSAGRSVNLDFFWCFAIIAPLLIYTFWFKDVDFECVPTSLMEHVVNFLNVRTRSLPQCYLPFFYPIRNYKVIAQL